MNIAYITGCDSKFFLMTGILLQAFKKQCPGRTLRVCDFGLSKQQSDILSHLGILLPKPSFLQDNMHPWIYKSSLIHYLTPLSVDIVVWLDSDCFPVGPFTRETEKIVSNWPYKRDSIAICQGKVGKNWQLASPKSNITHFEMRPSYPYYNSGVWILRSNRVLNEWASEIKKVPKNGMFEQDTFNYLLSKYKIEVQKLENDYWNVTHENLNNLTIGSGGKILLNNKEILIVHLTGVYKNLPVSIGSFKGTIRAILSPEIRKVQLQLLKEWVISAITQKKDKPFLNDSSFNYKK